MSYAPCLGCGWCCLTDQCGESHILHGYQKRCPELFFDKGSQKYRCRLVSQAKFRELLHMGQGCCAPLNAFRSDVRNRDADKR